MFRTEEERFEHQLSGVRNIFSNHTMYDRFNEMLFALGILREVKRDVLVIGRGDEATLRANVARQRIHTSDSS